MKNFRAIRRSIRWAFSVLFGLVLFIIGKPRAALAVPKLLVSKFHKLPKRVRYEACQNKVRTTIGQHLDECALIYLEQEPAVNEDTLKWLETIPFQGKYRWGSLYLLVRRLKPQIVVETGVCEGKSASYILQALADNGGGLLISIDLPNRFYLRDDGRLQADLLPFKEQPGRLIPNQLRDRWELIIGSSKKKLPALLEGLGKVDLFFHDSEHTYETMSFEFACVWPYLSLGGYLVADDVTSNSALIDIADIVGVKPTIIGGLGFLRKP